MQPPIRRDPAGRSRAPSTMPPPEHLGGDATWAAIDRDGRILAVARVDDYEPGSTAVRWPAGRRARTVVPLALRSGERPLVGDLVHVDADGVGHLVPDLASVSTTIAGLHAVLDAAARAVDGWTRHQLIERAVAELRELHQRHADALTALALLEAL